MQTDETDLAIIRHLWNGRTPYSDIAKELHITTNTVRNRVNKLSNSGILQIIGLVDPDAVPGHTSAFVCFKVKPQTLKQSLEQIGKLKGVVAAASVSGRYDIIAVVLFSEKYSHRDFINKELNTVEGLLAVETSFVIDGVNLQLRYVL